MMIFKIRNYSLNYKKYRCKMNSNRCEIKCNFNNNNNNKIWINSQI